MTSAESSPTLIQRVQGIVTWALALKPVRVFMNYAEKRGPILAGGLAYQALFAGFAALWAGFSIAGIVLAGDVRLREELIDLLAQAVPGLIASDTVEGAIDPDILLSAGGAFTLAAVIALVGLLVTALGWLDSARASVRSLFDLPAPTTNFAILKAMDLGIGVGLGVALLVSLGLSVASTAATDWVLGLVGLGDSTAAFVIGRILTALVMFGLNMVTLIALFRLLSGIRIPFLYLRAGIVFGAVGLSALQLLSSALIGGARANPLIASFAVIAGLLIFANFSCQVILIAASWIAVDVEDDGLVLDEALQQRRLEEARALVAANTEEEPAKRGLFTRLFRRDGSDPA